VTDLPPDPVRIRTDLAGSVQDIGRLFMRREEAIVAARRVGIPVAEIRSLAVEPVARTADEVIMEYEKERKASAFAATADLWKTGQVVEDRYGFAVARGHQLAEGATGVVLPVGGVAGVPRRGADGATRPAEIGPSGPGVRRRARV
jgi:hypothetical protein